MWSFDHCFVAILDQFYQVHNTARLYCLAKLRPLTASFRSSAPLEPNATPEQIANRIISLYRLALNKEHPNVIF